VLENTDFTSRRFWDSRLGQVAETPNGGLTNYFFTDTDTTSLPPGRACRSAMP
jgi:hypothetical protein